jgi:hypothetical protein
MKASVFDTIQDLFYGVSNYTFNILQVNNQINRALLTQYIKEKYGADNGRYKVKSVKCDNENNVTDSSTMCMDIVVELSPTYNYLEIH